MYMYMYVHIDSGVPQSPVRSWCIWWGEWEGGRCPSCCLDEELGLWPPAERQRLEEKHHNLQSIGATYMYIHVYMHMYVHTAIITCIDMYMDM